MASFLRRALNNPAFLESHAVQKSQILTNLGNQFDTVGRFIDAHWSKIWRWVSTQASTARATNGRGLGEPCRPHLRSAYATAKSSPRCTVGA